MEFVYFDMMVIIEELCCFSVEVVVGGVKFVVFFDCWVFGYFLWIW